MESKYIFILKKHETNIIQHLLAYLCGFNKSPNNLLRCKRNRSVLVKENFAFLTGKGNCGILKITERYTVREITLALHWILNWRLFIFSNDVEGLHTISIKWLDKLLLYCPQYCFLLISSLDS